MHIQLSRRSWLAGSAASLAMPFIPRGARAALARAASEPDWDKLGELVKNRVFRPDDPRFTPLTRPENLRYYRPDLPIDPDKPLGVVLPSNPDEVSESILWARKAGIPMVPRSGGHSYAGCSTVPGLVIHGGLMRDVTYRDGILEVQGGALNRDIFAVLKKTADKDGVGGQAITHGRCGTVGASAFLMGGGIGLDMRDNGVGCDLVESVDLVLSTGERVTASSSQYPDLFWAIRGGGGGNLGYAVSWRLRTKPASNLVGFVATWKATPAGIQDVFARIGSMLEQAPNPVGAQFSVIALPGNRPGPTTLRLTGQLRGTRLEFDQIVGPHLKDANPVVLVELPYWPAQDFFDIQSLPNRYQETSFFMRALTDDFIQETVRSLGTWPGTVAQARVTFFLTGGQVNATAPGDTAFVHRNSQWLANTVIDWTECDDTAHITENLEWQRNFHNHLAALVTSSGSYQNFADPGLANHGQAYWGSNLWRLVKVKRQYDPDFVFTPPRNQGIAAERRPRAVN